jgi:hypothetical protein
LLEVADGEFDHGVAAMVGVHRHGGAGAVGDERVVAPVRPQGGLRADQASAADDQPAFPVMAPLVFASSAFVPVASMPGWLQPFASTSRCR